MDGISIMLVEDNRHDVEMILDTISEHDIFDSVQTFSDGSEALDYFFGPKGCLMQEVISLPKLIILDLNLPKVGGLEILKRIKSDKRTKQIPIIIFTSSNEHDDRHESYRCGANSYIVKPLNADMFSLFVENILSYWVLMNSTTHDDT